jgi:hypothetical protein
MSLDSCGTGFSFSSKIKPVKFSRISTSLKTRWLGLSDPEQKRKTR